MVGAGLLAKKAVERGLKSKPWVKTSLAPGSKVVTDYSTKAGLTQYLEGLNFHLVGYGCTTCIGNSGPLEPIRQAIHSGRAGRDARCCRAIGTSRAGSAPTCAPTSWLRRRWWWPTPWPAGSTSTLQRAAREDTDGNPVYPEGSLAEPAGDRRHGALGGALRDVRRAEYGEVYAGDEQWREMPVPEGDTYAWEPDSTYVKLPPYFVDLPAEPSAGRGSGRRACGSAWWATRSPPTTSRRPERSRPTARPASIWSSTAWRPRTSTPTARGAATTK